MNSDQNDVASPDPKPCKNGCGFFGTATNMHLCSKCYSTLRSNEQQPPPTKATLDNSFFFIEQADPLVGLKNPSDSSSLQDEEGLSVSVVNRCGSCDKKVGLTGFKCKCGRVFCSSHRYPEEHACGFDYKGDGRVKIASNNPIVKADKLNRI